MANESRSAVTAAGAFAVVGAGIWFSLSATNPAERVGTVEEPQIQAPSPTVAVKPVGAMPSNGIVKAAVTRR